MNLVDTNFTLTGTLGLQSALLGRASIVAPAYYVTPGDFVLFGDPSAIADLPHRAAAWRAREDLAFRQRRMLSHLLQGSFEGDFFSFRGFNPAMAASGTRLLARNLGDCLRRVAAEGTDAFIDRSLP
jgi:hypothetical protein